MLRLLILEKNEWASRLFLVASNTSRVSSFDMNSIGKVKKKGRLFLKEHNKDASLFSRVINNTEIKHHLEQSSTL